MAYKVVIIDDSKEDRAMARLSLDQSDAFTVVGTAQDGLEGIRLIDSVWPDLALVDLSMPVMDGFEVLQHVEEKVPGTRVVVLTGHDIAEVEPRVKELGGLGVIPKGIGPLDTELLLAYMEPQDTARP